MPRQPHNQRRPPFRRTFLDRRILIAHTHSKAGWGSADHRCDVADPNGNRMPRLLLGVIARNERLVARRRSAYLQPGAALWQNKTPIPLDKSVEQHHFYWRDPVIFPSLVIMGDMSSTGVTNGGQR